MGGGKVQFEDSESINQSFKSFILDQPVLVSAVKSKFSPQERSRLQDHVSVKNMILFPSRLAGTQENFAVFYGSIAFIARRSTECIQSRSTDLTCAYLVSASCS